MTPARGMAVALALCAVATAGCGFGPGEGAGEVELTVTRDYGVEQLATGTQEATESDTVLRLLDREAEIETRYGGGFVQSIDGLSGGSEDGRRFDWFFYVNGIESPVGSADYEPAGGDRIWWDYRDWSSAMRAPAVVGSYPQPFLDGFEGERWPTLVECAGERPACELVEARLREAGAEPGSGSLAGPDGDVIRVLVGPYEDLDGDPTAGLLESPPSRSGVFARFGEAAPGRWSLSLLDAEGATAASPATAGLIAALRPGDEAPTWVITGTDEAGVRLAAEALDAGDLRDRYAVVASAGAVLGAPAPISGEGGG